MAVSYYSIHRFAAFSLAVFNLYAFMTGLNSKQFYILDDGSIIDSSHRSLACLKQSRALFAFKTGFNTYRSINYGVSSLLLMADVLMKTGYLSLPALVFTAGDIVNDFSDFCVAVVLVCLYIGRFQAAVYGITYFVLLSFEVLFWLGTCKFHQTCRFLNYEKELLRKRHDEKQLSKQKVS